jgi:hypothetical protein
MVWWAKVPEADRRRVTAAEPRIDAELLLLNPLPYEQAVRGLLGVKPDKGDERGGEDANGNRSRA